MEAEQPAERRHRFPGRDLHRPAAQEEGGRTWAGRPCECEGHVGATGTAAVMSDIPRAPCLHWARVASGRVVAIAPQVAVESSSLQLWSVSRLPPTTCQPQLLRTTLETGLPFMRGAPFWDTPGGL